MEGSGAPQGPAVVDAVDLPDGRRLVVREATIDDRDGLVELYRRLSVGDRWLRFFSAAAPSPGFLRRWLTIAERGGLLLVVLVEDPPEPPTLVAEAGYSLLTDGDGELGITVDEAWRGWLGSWLLGVLRREAARRGVANLQALVHLGNRPMLSTLRHLAPAAMAADAIDEVRLVIGTSGPTPTWPAGDDRPRILVEAAAGRWAGEFAATTAGFDVRTCRGPSADRPCPLLSGEGCRLAEGADVVVVMLPESAPTTQALLEAHRAEPGRQVVVPSFGAPGPDACDTAEEVVEQIRRTLGLA